MRWCAAWVGVALSLVGAGSARAEVALEIAGPGAPVVLGRATEIILEVRLPAPARAAAVPEVVVTTTPVRTVEPAGDGRWRVVLAPPPDSAPQVALIGVRVALAKPGGEARGLLALPLIGTALLPVRTEAGAEVTVTVAGKSFGPVLADKRGDAPVPIEVPPGTASALASSTSRRGTSSQETIQLPAPPFPRTLVLAPATLVAGGEGRLDVLAVDPTGAREPAPPALQTTLIHAPAAALPGGSHAFTVRAPDLLGAPAAAYQLAGLTGSIALSAAPPATLRVRALRDEASYGEPFAVLVRAADRFGNPHGGALEVSVDGAPTRFSEGAAPSSAEPGSRLLLVDMPARFPGRLWFTLRLAAGPAPPEELRVRFHLGDPAAITLTPLAARVRPGRPPAVRLRALDAAGGPASLDGVTIHAGAMPFTAVSCSGPGDCLYLGRRSDPARVTRLPVEARFGALRSATTLTLYPAPRRIELVPRVTMVSNLRKLHGVGALVELRARIAPEVSAGAEIGLLTAALTGRDAAGGTDVRLTQVPIYGVVRFLHGFTPRLWAGLGAQLGVTVARADFSTTGQPDQRRSAVGLSAGGGGTLELTLGPGRAVLDVRWVTGVVDVDLEGELLGLEAGAGYTVGF